MRQLSEYLVRAYYSNYTRTTYEGNSTMTSTERELRAESNLKAWIDCGRTTEQARMNFTSLGYLLDFSQPCEGVTMVAYDAIECKDVELST